MLLVWSALSIVHLAIFTVTLYFFTVQAMRMGLGENMIEVCKMTHDNSIMNPIVETIQGVS
jgi:hypothetical protein